MTARIWDSRILPPMPKRSRDPLESLSTTESSLMATLNKYKCLLPTDGHFPGDIVELTKEEFEGQNAGEVFPRFESLEEEPETTTEPEEATEPEESPEPEAKKKKKLFNK